MKDYKGNTTGLFTGIVEVWKDIDESVGKHQVSSFGNIRSLDRMRTNRWGTLSPVKGRSMKLKIGNNGYLTIHLRDRSIEHPSVHRLVAVAFIPNPDNKSTVNHKDGDKQNNNVSNLEWSTSAEQINHALSNGLIKVRGHSKFSTEYKQTIKDYHLKESCSIKTLAKVFDISERTAGRIANEGETIERKHLVIKDSDVAVILKMREDGNTLSSIATLFNCGISQIHRITRGESRNVVYER
jgi:hypothetical protein